MDAGSRTGIARAADCALAADHFLRTGRGHAPDRDRGDGADRAALGADAPRGRDRNRAMRTGRGGGADHAAVAGGGGLGAGGVCAVRVAGELRPRDARFGEQDRVTGLVSLPAADIAAGDHLVGVMGERGKRGGRAAKRLGAKMRLRAYVLIS